MSSDSMDPVSILPFSRRQSAFSGVGVMVGLSVGIGVTIVLRGVGVDETEAAGVSELEGVTVGEGSLVGEGCAV